MREAIIRLNNKKDDAELCIKQNEKITFKMLSKEELVKLYGEFLKVEETGFFDLDTDLDNIRKAYNEDFGSNTTWMLQIELTHAIADLWYEENK